MKDIFVVVEFFFNFFFVFLHVIHSCKSGNKVGSGHLVLLLSHRLLLSIILYLWLSPFSFSTPLIILYYM